MNEKIEFLNIQLRYHYKLEKINNISINVFMCSNKDQNISPLEISDYNTTIKRQLDL